MGISFDAMDVLMTIFGNHPERNMGMLLQAFFSRFAIGLPGANNLLSERLNATVAGGLPG